MKRTFVPWATLIVALFALGTFCRLYSVTEPAGFFFDEHHFVENARNYLQHKADWNDHPPLGKLFIAASIRVLGDRPIAWRLPSLIAGFLLLLAAWRAGSKLFASSFAGVLAAAFIAADGFFISYSRAALLDGLLALSVVLVAWLATKVWSMRVAVLAGVLLGAAMTVKFSGVGLVLPIVASWAMGSRRLRHLVIAFGLAALVYVSIYALGLSMAGQPSGVSGVFSATERLLAHHAGMTEMKHPLASGWLTWFGPSRSIVMHQREAGGLIEMITMLGNLALWWPAAALFFASLAALVLRGVGPVLRSESAAGFLNENGKAVVILVAAAIGFLAPWAISHRDSYLYHYLPAYTALLLLFAGFVGWASTRVPRAALGFVAVVLVVGAIYAPLWCGLPISRGAMRARLFMPGWK